MNKYDYMRQIDNIKAKARVRLVRLATVIVVGLVVLHAIFLKIHPVAAAARIFLLPWLR